MMGCACQVTEFSMSKSHAVYDEIGRYGAEFVLGEISKRDASMAHNPGS